MRHRIGIVTLCASLLLLSAVGVNGQTGATQNFAFLHDEDESESSSINGVAGCHNHVVLTVETSVPHGQLWNGTFPTPSLQVPHADLLAVAPDLAIDVTITFNVPVNNPRIFFTNLGYMEDFVDPSNNPPHETLSGFMPPLSSVDEFYTWSGTPDLVGGTVIPNSDDPDDYSDQSGILNWAGCHQEISFTYNRVVDDISLVLDHIVFDCTCPEACQTCECHAEALFEPKPSIPDADGISGMGLHLNSGGNPIRQVNISVPWYTSLSDPDCLDCNAHDASEDGNIIMMGQINETDGVFVGPPGIAHSGEITYCFDVPRAIDETVEFRVRFPELLELSCCEPSVEFCVKVQFIDRDCRFCEFLLCYPPVRAEGGRENPTITPINPTFQDRAEEQLIVFPNPTNGKIQAFIPEGFVNGKYVVNDNSGREALSGTASNSNLQLDVTSLPSGLYTLSLRNNSKVIKTTFAVEK